MADVIMVGLVAGIDIVIVLATLYHSGERRAEEADRPPLAVLAINVCIALTIGAIVVFLSNQFT